MKKILIFQHAAHEILGTLHPTLKDAGFRIRYINFKRTPHLRPQVERYDGLVILGGEMCVNETRSYPHLLVEIEAIKKMLELDRPILGICLGAQLIAKALGAKVTKNPKKEIGWYDVSLTQAGELDPLLKHFKPKEKIFQWHGDTFEIPKGCVHLAKSSSCKNQAFRFGDKVYGLQFHLEVDEAMIHRWLKRPFNILDLKKAGILGSKLETDTPKFIQQSLKLSKNTFKHYIKLFSSKTRHRALGSR